MVNGVNTISLHGKQYVEVAERVRLVHDQKREFEVLESVPFTIGERCLWRVVVKVDGKVYTGNAEVKLNARAGTPDATNPFECGETSALGRALAFAGFGTVESIASFDEVYRATHSEASTMPQNIGTSHHTANTTTGVSRPSQTVTEANTQNATVLTLIGKAQSRAKALEMGWGAVKINAGFGTIDDADLTLQHIGKINGYLAGKEREKQGAA